MTPRRIKQLSRSIPLPVRFGLQIDRDASGCWLWKGSRNGRGYGEIYVHGKKEMAHRASWLIHRGVIPDGLYVLHRCDCPPCVNPAHLFLGTNSDNMLDAAARGRLAHQGAAR